MVASFIKSNREKERFFMKESTCVLPKTVVIILIVYLLFANYDYVIISVHLWPTWSDIKSACISKIVILTGVYEIIGYHS